MKWITRTSWCILSIFLISAVFGRDVLCGAVEKVVPLRRIADAHKLQIIPSSQGEFILRRGDVKFAFKNASRTFSVNNVKILLGFPCSIRRRQSSILYSDYIAHVLPFLSPKKNYSQTPITVVIDPGHGGNDHGTVCNKLQEKMIVLDVAKKVATRLSAKGYKVLLTRTTDTFVPLDQRTNFANKCHATIFVSIHCNSAEARTASGIETFILTPYGQPSSSKNFQSPRDLKTFSNNKFDASNLLLAYQVQKNLTQQAHALDRGIKRSRFQVLKGLNCPGILIECGFLSNPNDRQKLISEQYRQILAEAISSGISNFLN
ncbi:MAG: N-acetylmuramoyl-L-alanine amidase [Opitutales bacterium]|nr:N-acetylmuramoyl-L-alanine amidase [Opitutales bacterium]